MTLWPGPFRTSFRADADAWQEWVAARNVTGWPAFEPRDIGSPQPSTSFGFSYGPYNPGWAAGIYSRLPIDLIVTPDAGSVTMSGFGRLTIRVTGNYQGTPFCAFGLQAEHPPTGFRCDFILVEFDARVVELQTHILEWCRLPAGMILTPWLGQRSGHVGADPNYPGIPDQGPAGFCEIADLRIMDLQAIDCGARIRTPRPVPGWPADLTDGIFATEPENGAESIYCEAIRNPRRRPADGLPLVTSSSEGWVRVVTTSVLNAAAAQPCAYHVSPSVSYDARTVPGTIVEARLVRANPQVPGDVTQESPALGTWRDTLSDIPHQLFRHLDELTAPAGAQVYAVDCRVLPGPNGEERVVNLGVVASFQGNAKYDGPLTFPSGKPHVGPRT